MSKKLTTNKLKTAAKKTYSMKKVVLTDINGEFWEVIVDRKMSPSKVEDMGKDMTLFIARLKEENIEEEPTIMDSVTENIYGFVILYILKYFTDLDIVEKETTKETVFAYVELLNNLYDMGLVEQLLEQFDKDAFARTVENLSDYITALDKNMKMLHGETAESTEIEVEEATNEVEHTEIEHVEVEQVE